MKKMVYNWGPPLILQQSKISKEEIVNNPFSSS